MKDLVCVGAVAGSFGVKGEIRIKSFCGEPAAIEDYSPLCDDKGNPAYTLSIVGQVKGGFSARVVEIKSKEQGDRMKGTRLYARRDQLPTLPDDEYYYSDLIGLAVFDVGGVELGHVKAVQNNGADDLLEVLPKGGGQSPLIPFTKSVVPTVDMAAGRIIVDPPEGLL